MGSFLFTSPWLLTALLALPALWWLLRITPPPPKIIPLPTARFMADLHADNPAAQTAPWWLLLLRLLIAALVILALAGPVLNPSQNLAGTAPLRLVIDNGWSAAGSWNVQIKKAKSLAAQAERENRNIYILPTAPLPGEASANQYGPIAAAQAGGILDNLAPLPWQADYAAALKLLQSTDAIKADNILLSDGLHHENMRALLRYIKDHGALEIFKPPQNNLPYILERKNNGALIARRAINIQSTQSFSVQALAAGSPIAQESLTWDDTQNEMPIKFDLPPEQRTDQFRILRGAGQAGAGGILLLDDDNRKRNVGIITSSPIENLTLTDGLYYVVQALDPFANLQTGSTDELTADQNLSMIIVTGEETLPAQSQNTLAQWVKDGGLLLRFAGAGSADESGVQNNNNTDILLPVTLRRTSRQTGGAVTWDTPPRLSAFPENSPFRALEITDEILIKKQILAEPSLTLAEKSWATLQDGTPLITHEKRGGGRIVFIHVAPDSAWSNLPLSGVFPHLMKRLVTLAGAPDRDFANTQTTLLPLSVLDGFGHLAPPDKTVRPLDISGEAQPAPTPLNPPGLYGSGGNIYALNLGASLPPLRALSDNIANINTQIYGATQEKNLTAILLSIALILFLIDWMIIMAMSRTWNSRTPKRARAALILAAFFCAMFSLPAQSIAAPQNTSRDYANGLYLAYIQTGDPTTDSITRKGLENLAQTLTLRTSVEPKGVAALDPQKDALAFFPLIYWAITDNPQAPSPDALRNIQNYLDHGGTILFDLRENTGGNLLARQYQNTPRSKALQSITSSLRVAPLQIVEKPHVLTKSFYLLDRFPGFFTGNNLWAEDIKDSGRDGVASILISRNDMARAWAMDRNSARSLENGPRQHELSLRSGVNLMMYTLTGNYKADQVHMTEILKRLGDE